MAQVVPQYPHLTPTPAVGPPVIVQIGLQDQNVKGSLPPGWSAGEVVYVLYKLSEQRSRPSRVMFTRGPVDTWKLGTTIWLTKSGTGENLGEYMIVGVKHYGNGEYAGQLPDRLTKACMML